MASLRLLALFAVLFVTISIAYGEDKGFGDSIAEEGKKLQEGAEKTATEGKNFFQSIGDKVGEYYHKAVESSKDAVKATGDAISNGYDKLKEKTKELME